ncbi:Inwardly rectifying k+ channellike, partial [Caligus rogercresseyi]
MKLIKDIFTTAVDMRVWWAIAYVHGDLESENLPNGPNQKNGSFTPCVWAIQDFTSCFPFLHRDTAYHR